MAPHPTGQWLASGGADGTLRVWEVASGRLLAVHTLGAPVARVAWCPDPSLQLLSAAAGSSLFLLPSGASSTVCPRTYMDMLCPLRSGYIGTLMQIS